MFLAKEGSPPKLDNEVTALSTSDKLLVEIKSPIPTGGVTHVLSPLKNVVASGVPVADKSAVTATAPSIGALGVRFINKPSVVVTVSTILAGKTGIAGKD